MYNTLNKVLIYSNSVIYINIISYKYYNWTENGNHETSFRYLKIVYIAQFTKRACMVQLMDRKRFRVCAVTRYNIMIGTRIHVMKIAGFETDYDFEYQ